MREQPSKLAAEIMVLAGTVASDAPMAVVAAAMLEAGAIILADVGEPERSAVATEGRARLEKVMVEGKGGRSR
jgi:hypothetical protein